MAHDLGNPPFGHFGEKILNKKMVNYGGFEGNAQTLRILSSLEKKNDVEIKHEVKKVTRGLYGLNLTARSLASILKYDQEIEKQVNISDQPKGYYKDEKPIIDFIKNSLLGKKSQRKVKTIECSIMDYADNIAYSVFDLEDAFKGELILPLDLITQKDEFWKMLSFEVNKDLKRFNNEALNFESIKSHLRRVYTNLFYPEDLPKEFYKSKVRTMMEYEVSKSHIESNGLRSGLSLKLVHLFVNSIKGEPVSESPCLTKIKMEQELELILAILKKFVFLKVTKSPEVKIGEFLAKEILEKLFDTFMDNTSLLPKDFQELINKGDNNVKPRIVCDFISGMTDRYAMEFYSRLFNVTSESFFKPI